MQWRQLGRGLGLGRLVGGENERGQVGPVARLWPKA
jgi:hypothetical protein